MAMIRAHRYGYIVPAAIYPSLLFIDHAFHYRVHIGAAAQMISLKKTAIGFPLYISQMQEMDVFTQPVYHSREVVVGTCA